MTMRRLWCRVFKHPSWAHRVTSESLVGGRIVQHTRCHLCGHVDVQIETFATATEPPATKVLSVTFDVNGRNYPGRPICGPPPQLGRERR